MVRSRIPIGIGREQVLLAIQDFLRGEPLPARPRDDLIGLLRSQGILVIYREGKGFLELGLQGLEEG